MLGGKERAVDQVVILPDRKSWSEQKRMVAPLPAASFGIRSTGALLWVSPSTLQPVASNVAYVTPRGGSLRIVSSHWENLGRSALDKITDQPKVPAGYKVTHS